MDISTQHSLPSDLPPEWELSAEDQALSISTCILIVTLFVFAGWKIGVGALVCVLAVFYIRRLFSRYKYGKKDKEFKNYVMSGLTPCLVYAKTDPIYDIFVLVVDDKLSNVFAHINAYCPAFYPTIVFLSDKAKEEFSKKRFADLRKSNLTEVQKFYNEHIAQLPSCKPTYENIAVIRDVLQYKQYVEDEDYLYEEQKAVRDALCGQKSVKKIDNKKRQNSKK